MAENRKKTTKEKTTTEKVATEKTKKPDFVYDGIGSLTFDEKVIKKIVGYSTSEIPGVLAMSGSLMSGIADALKFTEDAVKGISADVDDKTATVDLNVICEYGYSIPKIYKIIIDNAASAVAEMTGLRVVELNVHVSDILTKEDFDKKRKNVTQEEN